MFRRNALQLIAISALSISAGGLLTACSKSAPEFRGVDITGAEYAHDFALPDQDGKVRSLKDFAGKVVVVFFGYTQCPDVCPATMQELAQVKEMLGPDGERLQAVFVTVDPERDTPELLKAYMANFDPSFVALRGDDAQTIAVAKDFKIYFKKVDGQTPTSYTMDHSAGSYIFDPAGRVRVYSRYGSGPDAVAQDVRSLLNEAK
ncbi:SCO family protein [Simplicispira suum]|uniref:SCO family protein n=1 Tax=Simplicispira suum TaxID=2109915 RepID=A0A2S0N184_9BURK|nr:SCO family protein [Simplicispira suum]AVO41914.1 SCO family protein [Simplicispira suum]MBW7832744.1 SCO family protein [Simplicispira suum]